MVTAELDWLRYLSERGLSVAKAVPSLQGHWVEVIEVAGKSIPVVLFEKAPGHAPGDEDWNEMLFCQMGRFMGRMHHLTKEYRPVDTGSRRPIWSEDLDAFAAVYLPAGDQAIQQRYREIRIYPERLPQMPDAYGLVHVDFHRGNFFIHEGQLTLFDFDDCQYSWFAEDLAMALFYAAWPPERTEEKRCFAQTFYRAFLEGYRQENDLDKQWLNEIPYFLRQREICLYMVLTSLGEEQWDESVKRFMRGRRESILSGLPCVDINLTY
jgi:amicoumacin kinase